MIDLITYIDGLNLYHVINDLGIPSLKWLNLWSLSESLARRDERLVAVKYFSAFATWLPGPYSRHRRYVKALQHAGVETTMGRFKEKPRKCPKCKYQWFGHEEKETDVHIAITLVHDALTNKFQRAIVISADSDLGPAIRLAAATAPLKQIFVAAPPGRLTYARDLKPRLEVTRGRIAKHLFPEKLYDHSGNIVVERPMEYRR
jgi:NYN domain-containing protein